MISRILLVVAVAASLVGCGSVEVRSKPGEFFSFESHAHVSSALYTKLADAPVCCASLAELPYQNITKAGVISTEINADSPAYIFESGKSFFAAYRLTGLPRPITIGVASRLTSEQGSHALLILGGKTLVFAPVALILDDKFNIQKTIGPNKPLTGCKINQNEDVYLTHFDILDPPTLASYLIVLTTEALLAQDGDNVCGVIQHGFSPIGDISVRIASLDFNDGAILLKSWWQWYPNTQDPRFFAGMFQDPGLLILGNTAVHFLESVEFRYVERLRIPYDRIVLAKVDPHRGGNFGNFIIGSLDQSGNSLVYHTFGKWFSSGETIVPAKDFVSQLAARIRPDLFVEKIGFVVAKPTPTVEFRAKDGTAHIGEAALAGGLVTASPCGLCQAGGCTPDMALTCAALFSVGAVIGVSVEIGHELVTNVFGNAPQPPDISREMKRSMDPVVEMAKSEKFDQTDLQKCVAQELGEERNSAWHDQGRKALLSERSQVDSLTADKSGFQNNLKAQGYQYGTESFVSRIALIPEDKSAQTLAEVPVHLLLEGEVRFIDLSRNDVRTSQVSWKSPQHKLEDWIKFGPRLVGDAMKQGCHELAKQIIEVSQRFWKQQ